MTDITYFTIKRKSECKVCFDRSINYVKLPCNHCLCRSCLDDMRTYRLRRCPFCNTRFSAVDYRDSKRV